MAEIPDINLSQLGVSKYGSFSVEVVDPVSDYLNLLEVSGWTTLCMCLYVYACYDIFPLCVVLLSKIPFLGIRQSFSQVLNVRFIFLRKVLRNQNILKHKSSKRIVKMCGLFSLKNINKNQNSY